MTLLPSVAATIGQTPLVALDRLTRGLPGRILAKLETVNPGGSVKDRTPWPSPRPQSGRGA